MMNEARTYTIRTRTRLTGITRTSGQATGTRHSEAYFWICKEARKLSMTGRYDKVEVIDKATKETITTIL